MAEVADQPLSVDATDTGTGASAPIAAATSQQIQAAEEQTRVKVGAGI